MTLNVWQRNIVDESGNIISEAEIEVFYAGLATKPTLYSSITGDALTNPFDASVSGFAQFYAADGLYDIAVNGDVLWSDVPLGNNIIENVAALSTFTPVVGQVYYLKEFESGAGTAGGPIEAKAGAITPDNKNTFASASSGVYFERLIPEIFQVVEKKSAASFFGTNKTYSAIILLGDSNSEGVGTALNSYSDGFAGQFMRATANSFDAGAGSDRGFRYESVLKMQKALENGITSSGSIISGGLCDSRLSLADTQSITITGREIASADVFYEASLSSGSLEFRINGSLYKTVSITGTGTKDTFPSYFYGNSWVCKETDVITITSVGGTVVITEILAIRYSASTPLLYSIVRQGWGLEDFAEPAHVAEAAAHVERFVSGKDKLVIVCLGTNNQNGVVGRELSPTDYVLALNDLIYKYAVALQAGGGVVSFAVWVPPKTLDARPLGTYQQYIDAIVEYCSTRPLIQCIRMDKSALGYEVADYFADARHFNDLGHKLAARILCDNFGVPQDFLSLPKFRTLQVPSTFSPVVLGTSVAGSNTYSVRDFRYKSQNEICTFVCNVTLSAKDAAMSGDIRITLPLISQAGNQPVSVSSYTGVNLTAGYTQLGAVILGASNAIVLIQMGSGVSPVLINASNITSSFSVSISGTYFSE